MRNRFRQARRTIGRRARNTRDVARGRATVRGQRSGILGRIRGAASAAFGASVYPTNT